MGIKNDGADQLGLFSSSSLPEAVKVVSLPTKDLVTPKKTVWVNPSLLSDHPLNTQLFGDARLTNVEDLASALSSGYDSSRAIKCVQRPNGGLTIIDGHRRKRAAEIVNCQVAVVIQSFQSESDEIEEMILSNIVRNRSYSRCGIGTAVKLIQMVKPRQVRRGRRAGKNQAPEANISKKGEKSGAEVTHTIDQTDQGVESRRAYYAALLGISEKKFRLVDYVLQHGMDDERRELDVGPRTLAAIHKAVRARVTGEEEGNDQDPRIVVRAAREALRAAISLFSLIGAEGCTEEIELGIKSLTQLAKSETAGAKPEGTTTAYVLKLYRKLLTQTLRGTKIIKE